MYVQHGGSGLGMSHGDILELSYNDAVWFAEKVNETREREARALREAHRRR
jgi:hypothetical protein